MVRMSNFFGARGRAVDPTSDRQLSMACKAQGLVFDKETKQCRQKLKPGRAPAPGLPASIAALSAECRKQGLVYDLGMRGCRPSRRGASLPAARAARAANRAFAGPTQKQMMEACRARGLVFDRDTKECRERKVRRSALEQAYARGSLFFGKNKFGARGREIDPNSDRQRAMACKARGLVFDKDTKQCRQPLKRGRAPVSGPSVASLRAACKAQGLVLDMDSKQCRESRRGAGLAAARTARAAKRVLAGPTQKEMMAACKAQGLVFDRDTKKCRERKVRGSALEQAYARGSLFFGKNKFGVNQPASAQRAGIVYHSPASALTSPYYGIIGPVAGKITGPASFQVQSSTVTPTMAKELGVLIPKTPAAPAKKPAKKPSKFGTYSKGPKGRLIM